MNETINIPPSGIPSSLHHSHQYQQMDLGDTIILYAGEGPGGQLAIGGVFNIDDFPCLEESQVEDVERVAVETADKIVRAYNSHDGLINALQPFADQPVADDAPCHLGLTTKEKCGRCSRILSARAAIAKGKGEPNADRA